MKNVFLNQKRNLLIQKGLGQKVSYTDVTVEDRKEPMSEIGFCYPWQRMGSGSGIKKGISTQRSRWIRLGPKDPDG